MFNTEKKLRERIAVLENQVEILITEKDQERNKKLKELKTVTEKLESLEKEKKNLRNTNEDLKASNTREEENIQHKVKIVMEKNEFNLAKKIQEAEKAKDVEVGKIKDEYRNKREKQLEDQSANMKEMYTDVLDKLTKVTGTLSQPQQVANNGNLNK